MVAGWQPRPSVQLFRYLCLLLFIYGIVDHTANANEIECPSGKIMFKSKTIGTGIQEYSRQVDVKYHKSFNGYCHVAFEKQANVANTAIFFNSNNKEFQAQGDTMELKSNTYSASMAYRFKQWEPFFHRIEESIKNYTGAAESKHHFDDLLEHFRFALKIGIAFDPPRTLSYDDLYDPTLVSKSTSTITTTTTSTTTKTSTTTSISALQNTSVIVSLSTVSGSTQKIASPDLSTSIAITDVSVNTEDSTAKIYENPEIPVYLIVLLVFFALSALSSTIWALCVTIKFKKYKRQSRQTIEDLNLQLQTAREERAPSESQNGGLQQSSLPTMTATTIVARDQDQERVKELEQDLQKKKDDNVALENKIKELEDELKNTKESLETKNKELLNTKKELADSEDSNRQVEKELAVMKENEVLHKKHADKDFDAAVRHEYAQHENVFEAQNSLAEIDRLYKRIRNAQKIDTGSDCTEDYKDLEFEMKELTNILARAQNTFLEVFDCQREVDRNQFLQQKYNHFLINKDKMTEKAQNNPKQRPQLDAKTKKGVDRALMMYKRKLEYWDKVNKMNKENREKEASGSKISQIEKTSGPAMNNQMGKNSEEKKNDQIKKDCQIKENKEKSQKSHHSALSKHSVIEKNSHISRNGQANMKGPRSKNSQNMKNVQARKLYSPPDR